MKLAFCHFLEVIPIEIIIFFRPLKDSLKNKYRSDTEHIFILCLGRDVFSMPLWSQQAAATEIYGKCENRWKKKDATFCTLGNLTIISWNKSDIVYSGRQVVNKILGGSLF